MTRTLRRLLCALIASVLLISTPAMAASYSMYFHTSSKVYAKASSSSRSAEVSKGTKVTLVAAKDGWALVKKNGMYAFCKLKDLNLSSRIGAYVVKKTPLYKSASRSSTKTDAIGVNTKVYIVGISGDYFRVQNESGSLTGYMPTGCVGASKVKTNTSTGSGSSSGNSSSSVKPSSWKSKVVAPDWYDGGSSVLKKGEYGTLYDISTGISLRVYRMGGSSHADLEPATAEDTEKLKKIAGGEFSWDSHAVILISDGVYAACAINTMPHGDQTILDNNYDGQFCLHMLGSKTHGSDSVNTEHQNAIQLAYRWAHS